MKLKAEKFIDGIPVNPKIPKGFWDLDNALRPASHAPWWFQPFVLTVPNDLWVGGIRYDTYCLDGGAWDRPTNWGKFGTLEEAIPCAWEGPVWRREQGLV